SITVEIIEIPATFALLGGAATTESFESVVNPPGPDEIIDAIMGGGMVRGTECVNGKVDPEATNKQNDAMSYGPDQTLYVANGAAVNLRSADDYAFRAGDEVFSRVIGGGKEGNPLPYTCQFGNTSIGSFASSSSCSGGSLPFGSGEGSHELVFLTKTGTEVVLGRLYKTTPNVSGGVTESYSCSPPGLLPPDKPQMRGAEPHASGGMLVEFDQKGPGGDPDYYLYKMLHEDGIANRDGRVVDEQGNDDTSSPFVITPEAALSLTAGQWKVRIQALNAAGGSEWSEYSELITPSVEEPPVPHAPVITDVTTANGKATISFIAPEDNGEAITNYAYRLTSEFDDPGEYEELAPPITTSPFTLAGLNNGETYTVSIAAINANGMGPDSNEEEFTVGTQCEDVTDWTTPANTMGYFCSVGLSDYAYADFHILTTIDSQPDVCSTPANYLPTDDNNGAGLFCQQRGSDVRALFDWGWGQNDPRCSDKVLNGNEQDICLYWLQSASQFGSRAARPGDASGLTVAGRVPNQLANGKWAFARFAGEGGSGFQSLDTSNLTSLSYVFARATSFKEDISAWDTSKVTELNRAFWLSGFDRPIPTTTNGSAWDVSQVRNFDGAFTNSFNQDLSSWNVGNARQLSDMFKNNHHFNQNLSAWADKLTELVTMENMFNGARAFNNGSASGASDQPLSWGATPKLTKMNYTFASATSFNQQIFADGASTAGVDNMAGLFKNATAFNRDIGDWNTQSLQKTASMFEGATAFNKDIGSWSTGLITNMNAMFKNAEAFNQDLSGWVLGKRAIDLSSFDEGADAWCGLGFRNRGRPDAVSPSEAESCALSLVIDAPESAVAGDQFDYVLRYYNESSMDFDTGTLSLTLPTGLSVVDEGDGTATGQTVSWTGLEVPAGS
ncbi:MAG: BspA family leucine-rich repeat surface protein, partial [Gammaproteobacteria bacterium]|nr:BspA family leucine-rich repeat surface protein [Gammaproteobacteria bacterium]